MFAAIVIAILGTTPGVAIAGPQITDRFLVIAHKTGPLDAPENTTAGMIIAKKKNPELTWVEVDVRWSKSDFPFLMHNETLDKTTNLSGKLADKWFSEVMDGNAADYAPWNNKKADGSWVYPDYHGKVTLADGSTDDKFHPPYAWDFFDKAKQQDLNLLLDVKEVPDKASADKLYEYISRFGYQDHVIYMSSHDGVLTMRNWYPNLEYMVIEYPPTDLLREAESIQAIGASGYALPIKEITKSKVDYYKANNLRVFTWTSDSVEIDKGPNWWKAYDAGVDALITNEHVEAESVLP